MYALPRAARWYLYTLWLLALVLAAATLWRLSGPPAHLALLGFTTLIYILADYFEVGYGINGRDRVAMTIVDAVAIFLVPITGPYGLGVIVVGSLAVDMLRDRPWFKALFNVAQRVIIFVVMLLLYQALSLPGAPAFSGPHGLTAFLALTVSYYLLNTFLVSTIVALASGRPLLQIYADSYRQAHWVHFITMPYGAVLAYLWKTNPWLILPAMVPLLMAQRSFQAMASWQEESRRNRELATQATALVEQLRAHQDELVRSSKLAALGTFAAGIAHEFNNLLAAILGYAQLALSTDDVAEKNEALEVAMRACLRGRSITSGLLTFARRRDPRRETCNLADLVAETVTLVQREFAKVNVTIEQRLQSVPTVVCDSGQIAQVLINLLTNARDAMAGQQGGRIEINLSATTNSVEIAVTDTGSGIPAELLPHIFQPFTTTKGALGGSTTAGTGLGLAISHGIIERHGGSIRVCSTVGQGTTMTVSLPVATLPTGEEPDGSLPEMHPLHILIIDDEVDVAEWLRRGLERHGHLVEVAYDTRQGVERYRAHPFDLVLCDAIIPGGDGVAMLQQLRSYDPQARVLVMTGQTGAAQVDRMLELGALSVLSKPFALDDLLALIRRIAPPQSVSVGSGTTRPLV